MIPSRCFATALVSLLWGVASSAPLGWDEYQEFGDWDDYEEYYDRHVITHFGLATVYTQDNMAGSCGNWHSDNDYVAALGNAWMFNQYQAVECGQRIQVTNVGSDYGVGGVGNSILVTVQDTCESCDESHFDLSVAAWNALTEGDAPGEVHLQWRFVDVDNSRFEQDFYEEDYDDDQDSDDDWDDDDNYGYDYDDHWDEWKSWDEEEYDHDY